MMFGKLWWRPVVGVLVCCWLAASGVQAQRIAGPQLETEIELLADDGAFSDEYGLSVALNGDTVVVGSRRDQDNGVDSGSAYVYVRDNGVWTEEAKLLPIDGSAEDLFGHSVSISGDTALIGAWRDDDNGDDSGSAYVFVRSGGVWMEEAKLSPSDGDAGDFFGWTGVIHGDTAIIGAFGDDELGTDSGSAYVFVRNGTVWTEQDKLVPVDGAGGDLFGKAVVVAGDTAVVGSRWDDVSGENSGSAYVFERNGTSWNEQAKLVPDDGQAFDVFGRDVWLSGDTTVIGAPTADGLAPDTGAAYVFVRSGNDWEQQAKLQADDGAQGDVFGKSVTISGDMALISSPKGEIVEAGTERIPSGEGAGSAYVFARSGSSWTQVDKLVPSDGGVKDLFGWDVSLVGKTAVVGSPLHDDNGENSGAAYVYEPDGLILSISGTCPGEVTLHLTNAPPNSEVGSVNAENNGGFVKGGTLCNGVNLEIGEPFQLPPTWIKVDSLGNGSGTREMEADRCWIESLALANCETTGATFVD